MEHPRPSAPQPVLRLLHQTALSLHQVNSGSFLCATKAGVFQAAVVIGTSLGMMTNPQPALSIFWGQPQGQVGMDATMSKPFLMDTKDLGWQFGLSLKPSCPTGTLLLGMMRTDMPCNGKSLLSALGCILEDASLDPNPEL